VRIQTADGQVRTTVPAPRPPLWLPKEEVRRAVRALAQEVVPVADPVEFARKRFEVPIREGVYLFSVRTKELKPADRMTEAEEEPPPELLEQARRYLQWCADRHQSGDCLGALRGHRTLDAYGRYTVTMGIALASTFEATGESLEEMVTVKEVLGMVVAGVTMYAVLWVLPEPTSKAIAAAMTIVLVGWVGLHTLYTLGTGWSDLIDRADAATTFDALKDAGRDYAKVMGADNARILVMVATSAVGSGLSQFLKALPTLPGAGPASELAVAEGGVSFEQAGAVEGVTIGKGGLTISLTTGAVLASSLSGNFQPGNATGGHTVGEPNVPRKIAIDEKQLQAKFKHAPDFGVSGNYNKANASELSRAIERHVQDPAVRVIEGTYHRAPVIHYLDPTTGLNVMTDLAGNFISGWRLSAEQLQNVLAHGGL